MEQKILVALDDSSNAMRTVEFITKTFSPKGCKITLFSVIPSTAALCDMNSPELTPYFLSQQSIFCQLEDQKKQLINEALKKAKNILVNAGFDEKRIKIKIKPKIKGIARDIIAEASTGYSLVIMGRRGLSGVQEFLLGSVSQKVLHSIKDVSVLIVN